MSSNVLGLKVLVVSDSVQNVEVKNLSNYVEMRIPLNNGNSGAEEDFECKYWDVEKKKWSTEGV